MVYYTDNYDAYMESRLDARFRARLFGVVERAIRSLGKSGALCSVIRFDKWVRWVRFCLSFIRDPASAPLSEMLGVARVRVIRYESALNKWRVLCLRPVLHSEDLRACILQVM